MFYNENVTINQVEEDPSLIFTLIKEGHNKLVDKILSKKNIDINLTNEEGNSILMVLLRCGAYDVVFKYINDKSFDINYQNNDGDTIVHILVTMKYANTLDILKKVIKNKKFIPNIKNNLGETILDKSINNGYIYTSIKILEDKRFNNIDLISFRNLYNTYINSKEYGKYTKISNLETIIEYLDKKNLIPRMEELISNIKNNLEIIKEEMKSNNLKSLNTIINTSMMEVV